MKSSSKVNQQLLCYCRWFLCLYDIIQSKKPNYENISHFCLPHFFIALLQLIHDHQRSAALRGSRRPSIIFDFLSPSSSSNSLPNKAGFASSPPPAHSISSPRNRNAIAFLLRVGSSSIFPFSTHVLTCPGLARCSLAGMVIYFQDHDHVFMCFLRPSRCCCCCCMEPAFCFVTISLFASLPQLLQLPQRPEFITTHQLILIARLFPRGTSSVVSTTA